MRILSCFLQATGGTVKIAGMDITRDSVKVRGRIGYLPENSPVYHDMRVVEYLRYRGALKGLLGRKLRDRVEEVVLDCGLSEKKNKIIATLSKGYIQRVGLADSLISQPDVLILDEPTIGLDPNQIRNIRSLIRNFASNHTVLLSSHILSEVEMICERVLIINRGRIVAADTTANLTGLMHGNPSIVVEVAGSQDDIKRKLSVISGVENVVCEAEGRWNRFTCSCAKGSDVRVDICRTATQNRWDMRELRMEKRNLEDVFVEMTTQVAGFDKDRMRYPGDRTEEKETDQT